MVPLCPGHSGLHLVLIVPAYCSSQNNVNDIGCSRFFQGSLMPLLALNLVRPWGIPAFEHIPSPRLACFLPYHCPETTLARGLLTSTILGYCHQPLPHVPGAPLPQWSPTFLVSVSSLHGKLMGKKWKQWQTSLSWASKSLWTVTETMKLKDGCSLEGKLWQT